MCIVLPWHSFLTICVALHFTFILHSSSQVCLKLSMTGGIQTDGLLQSAFQNANFFTLEDDSLFFLLDVSLFFFFFF